MWRVESFTRVGYPLGSRWDSRWHTRWVLGLVLLAVLPGHLDSLLSLGNLVVDPRLVPQSILANREVAVGHLADGGLVAGTDRAGNLEQLVEVSRERPFLRVVRHQQAQIGAVLLHRQPRRIAQVVARVELEVVHAASAQTCSGFPYGPVSCRSVLTSAPASVSTVIARRMLVSGARSGM